MMLTCGLSSARSERRLRVPRGEHEKQIRNHLDSDKNDDNSNDFDTIAKWIQKLVKCRSDFRLLDPAAVCYFYNFNS